MCFNINLFLNKCPRKRSSYLTSLERHLTAFVAAKCHTGRKRRGSKKSTHSYLSYRKKESLCCTTIGPYLNSRSTNHLKFSFLYSGNSNTYHVLKLATLIKNSVNKFYTSIDTKKEAWLTLSKGFRSSLVHKIDLQCVPFPSWKTMIVY